MKKATTKLDPNAASLRELPELELSRYRVRRNPFAARIAREGVTIVHDGPSSASLKEVPEADFTTARVRRNPYAARAAETSMLLQYGRGRPARGREVGPTTVRSLRLPDQLWDALDREAKLRETSTHALLRDLIAMFLQRR